MTPQLLWCSNIWKVATLRKFQRVFSAAWRTFSYVGKVQHEWLDEDRTALIQYLNSSHGKRLKALLAGYCSLRESRACMAGGSPFESGKAIGCRELLATLEVLGQLQDNNSEAADIGDTADLGHLVP